MRLKKNFLKNCFLVFSEVRILAKIRVSVLDFVGYVDLLAKLGAKSGFRVSRWGKLIFTG